MFNKGSNLDIPWQQPFLITLSLGRWSMLKKTAQIIVQGLYITIGKLKVVKLPII